jgi:hypothetical protein
MTTTYALPSGRVFTLENAARKLELRAGLPGAYLYDRATQALRRARASGLVGDARLDLAFASSWLVNSPLPSPALRALATPPAREVLAALVSALEVLPEEIDDTLAEELATGVESLSSVLGDKRSSGAEGLSKLLALLVPESVPLLPSPACEFLLGTPPSDPGPRFVEGLRAFRRAAFALYDGLVDVAREHSVAVLDAAQVLDRLLWVDSEGYKHLPELAKARAEVGSEAG